MKERKKNGVIKKKLALSIKMMMEQFNYNLTKMCVRVYKFNFEGANGMR